MNDNKAQAAYFPQQPPGAPMTTNQERAAEVIDEWQCDNTSHGTPEQLAHALADAGRLAPDLPKPVYEGSTTWEVPGRNEWQTDTYKGEVMLEVDVEEQGSFHPLMVTKTWFMQRDEACALAYSLLAAAEYAEQEQDHG